MSDAELFADKSITSSSFIYHTLLFNCSTQICTHLYAVYTQYVQYTPVRSIYSVLSNKQESSGPAEGDQNPLRQTASRSVYM